LLLGIKPLHLEIVKTGMAASLRLKELIPLEWDGVFKGKKKNNLSHLKYWENMESNLSARNDLLDRSTSEKCEPTFNINLNSFSGGARFRNQSEVNVYTDGSKLEGKTGAGFVIYKRREVIGEDAIRLPDKCTVFQAEIVAVQKAGNGLLNLMQRGVEMRYVKIFIDSQAAILALNNGSGHRSVTEAVSTLGRNVDT
jgi:hypothetical protein